MTTDIEIKEKAQESTRKLRGSLEKLQQQVTYLLFALEAGDEKGITAFCDSSIDFWNITIRQAPGTLRYVKQQLFEIK